MHTVRRFGLGMTALLLGVGAAMGQDAQQVAQQKLLSKRAAEADAYRKLAEAVYGLQIDSTTLVKDFVTESDQIRTSVDAFVRGVRLGTPTWYEDLTCEVPAEVTVAQVVETLLEAHRRYYKGNTIKTTDIQSITQRVEKQVIKAIGMGAPRPELPPELPAGTEELLTQVTVPATSGPAPLPPIWKSISGQGRLMAIRAARVDALRKMAEQLKGLRLNSETRVRDFVTESDVITTEMQAYLTGAEEVRTYLHDNDLIAEVTVRVPTEQIITTIKKLYSRHYKDGHIKELDIESIVKNVVKKDYEATGMGVPPPQFVRETYTKLQVNAPDWVTTDIQAEGNGTDPAFDTPQGRLKAARAAELDAKRKLVEQIKGLSIRSDTFVKDFVTEHDHIATQVNAVLVDATVVSTRFDDGVATVRVSVPGARVWTIVYEQITRETRR
ncbi:MAG: LPP20 family lipoprotein [Phycisphaerae bacterium]|jgi:hypothetical protein|nr:LPP20 family lipoprotein [Phycisphaerae bacterium]